jgi:hypothetical protein
MEPIKSMVPIKPITDVDRWWPDQFGDPTVVGSQSSTRYAFFPAERRLLIERNGRLETYDSAGRQITKFCLRLTHEESLAFETTDGPLNLDELKLL